MLMYNQVIGGLQVSSRVNCDRSLDPGIIKLFFAL
jgi:hypothetical protein